jgi:HD-GYP domain-containing protein (c-di-GMP phosphodiesterase class II)
LAKSAFQTDGRGYPQRLAGTDIPLAARIVAVADVYDALTSKRVYKGSFAHTVAREIIIADAGSHFDPDLVAAFQAAESEFLEIRLRFAPRAMALDGEPALAN